MPQIFQMSSKRSSDGDGDDMDPRSGKYRKLTVPSPTQSQVSRQTVTSQTNNLFNSVPGSSDQVNTKPALVNRQPVTSQSNNRFPTGMTFATHPSFPLPPRESLLAPRPNPSSSAMKFANAGFGGFTSLMPPVEPSTTGVQGFGFKATDPHATSAFCFNTSDPSTGTDAFGGWNSAKATTAKSRKGDRPRALITYDDDEGATHWSDEPRPTSMRRRRGSYGTDLHALFARVAGKLPKPADGAQKESADKWVNEQNAIPEAILEANKSVNEQNATIEAIREATKSMQDTMKATLHAIQEANKTLQATRKAALDSIQEAVKSMQATRKATLDAIQEANKTMQESLKAINEASNAKELPKDLSRPEVLSALAEAEVISSGPEASTE